MKMQKIEVVKVDEFPYLGSTIQNNRQCLPEERRECRQGDVGEDERRSNL